MSRLVGATLAFLILLSLPAQSMEWVAKRGGKFSSPSEGQKVPNGLPDGYLATISQGDVASAWYSMPTRRYRHAILGDDIEAGGLTVKTRNGITRELALPQNMVFEDRTPRLRDLDGNGTVEIITLLSSASGGAAIAVYGLVGGQLQQVAQTPFIGRSNRWRNIAGIADYNGDGDLEIAEIVTPHIGGTLKFWSWRGQQLTLIAEKAYYSNHAIGAREQRLSATADFDGDGQLDIAVPGRGRDSLHLIGFAKGKNRLQELSSIYLPATISHPILLQGKDQPARLTVKLSNGSVWTIQPK